MITIIFILTINKWIPESLFPTLNSELNQQKVFVAGSFHYSGNSCCFLFETGKVDYLETRRIVMIHTGKKETLVIGKSLNITLNWTLSWWKLWAFRVRTVCSWKSEKWCFLFLVGLTITLICYDNILLCKVAAAQGDSMMETNTETKDVLDP